MPLEENGNIHLLEDFREDAGLFGRLGLKPCGNAFDELLARDCPAVAGAKMGKLPGLNVRSALVGDQNYDVARKLHFLLREFVHKFPGRQHVGDWYERPRMGLVDILEN